MKKIKMSEKTRKVLSIVSYVGCGAVIGIAASKWIKIEPAHSNADMLTIVTNKSVTRPGVRLISDNRKRHVSFLFDNVKDAKEFTELFSKCIEDCKENINKA